MVESKATVKAVLSKSLFLLRAMIANPFESSVGKVGAYEVLSAGTKRNPFLAATTLCNYAMKSGSPLDIVLPIGVPQVPA